MQNKRFPLNYKVGNGINTPFLFNKHGDPQFFFQVFAKNSLMKNIIEEEKKFDSRARFILEYSSLLGVFWPRRGIQVNHGTVQNSAIFLQPSNQNSLNEAILFIPINEALLSR